MSSRLGELLIDSGLINEEQLGQAVEAQRTGGGSLGSQLTRLGLVEEADVQK
jgi:hypothetical protein